MGGRFFQLQKAVVFVVYHCPAAASGQVPDSTLGSKIDRELTKQTHDHLIIFTDAAQTTQVWQWVKRKAGAALACRRHMFHASQPGDSFLQKLDKLFVSLEEEGPGVESRGGEISELTGRNQTLWDVEYRSAESIAARSVG